MGRGAQRILVLLLIAAVVGLLVQRHQLAEARRGRERADLEAGLYASRVLSARLREAGSLRTDVLTGEVMSQGSCTSAFVFDDQQRTVAPYSVNYFVDLAKVDAGSFRWDAAHRTLFVEVPGVTVDRPNVELTRARSRQTGTFISRGCGLAMQGQIAARLANAASERAGRPEYLVAAGDTARRLLAGLMRAPLAAAGLGDVQVRVRLSSDPRPAGDRRWDLSRTIPQVLADPRLR